MCLALIRTALAAVLVGCRAVEEDVLKYILNWVAPDGSPDAESDPIDTFSSNGKSAVDSEDSEGQSLRTGGPHGPDMC